MTSLPVRHHTPPIRRTLAALVAFQCWGCGPPTGPEPPRVGTAAATSSSQAPVDRTHDLVPLALPEVLPAAVYTRSAPVSLVDEHGTPLVVLAGHHTRLTLLHTWADRAEVRCEVCPEPVEGWVQTRLLMPTDHEGTTAERQDPRLALALVAADLRRAAEAGTAVAGHDLDPDQRSQLLALLDQGLAERDSEALAPSFGQALAHDTGSLRLRLRPTGWEVVALDLTTRD